MAYPSRFCLVQFDCVNGSLCEEIQCPAKLVIVKRLQAVDETVS